VATPSSHQGKSGHNGHVPVMLPLSLSSPFEGGSTGHKFMHAVHKIQIKGAATAAAASASAHPASDKYTF